MFQVAHDPRCAKSGVYWSWNGGPREGRGAEALEKGGQISGGGGAGGGWDSIFENDQSAKVLDVEAALKLYQYATSITGAEWPELKAITSPCPTLKVISAVTKGMVQREELKRMREMGRPGMDAKPVKVSKVKKTVAVADRVATGVLSNTVGRVARFMGRRVLGEFPDEALTGSFDVEKASNDDDADVEVIAAESVHFDMLEEDRELFEEEVLPKISAEDKENLVVDEEDEALFRQIYKEETESKPKITIQA